jgi:polysaccharide biosynthesis transport protein
VVLIVAALAVLPAALHSLDTHPTYVGKSVLLLSSPGRVPEQDATMAVGFAVLFNDPATIDRLRPKANVPQDVTFEAQTVGASPILTVTATADDPQVAQDAAKHMAETFRDDINFIRRKGKGEAVADLEQQLSTLNQFAPDGSANPVYAAMQDRMDQIRYESATNELQDLQLRAGVTKIEPKTRVNIATAAVGGLLLGILAALGMATVSTRLKDADDLQDKTGVQTLVQLPSSRSSRLKTLREDRMRTLANVVTLQNLPKSAVIALTDSSGVRGARALAEALAKVWAQQGNRTVLIYADNVASQPIEGAGFHDALMDSNLVDSLLQPSGFESLRILPSGSGVTDDSSRTTSERIAAILIELRGRADKIVIAAPPIADTTDSQLVCAAADLTLLVVSTRSSRSGHVTSAVEKLAQSNAVLLGAVLIDETDVPSARKAPDRRSKPMLVEPSQVVGIGRHSD